VDVDADEVVESRVELVGLVDPVGVDLVAERGFAAVGLAAVVDAVAAVAVAVAVAVVAVVVVAAAAAEVVVGVAAVVAAEPLERVPVSLEL